MCFVYSKEITCAAIHCSPNAVVASAQKSRTRLLTFAAIESTETIHNSDVDVPSVNFEVMFRIKSDDCHVYIMDNR